MNPEGSYVKLFRSGELRRRRDLACSLLKSCDLCARRCSVDRLSGEVGSCRSGYDMAVSGHGPHFGEEREISGSRGSGTIFFSGCNLGCVFCQNWDISHERQGRPCSEERLAEIMVDLQDMGCHNINLVTPTHFMPQILSSLVHACSMGLEIPIVYNCGGYESVRALRLLHGIVDIYMPDVKFADEHTGARLAKAPGYFEVVKMALKEMHAQVGDLVTDEEGIATKGLLVRHLVLPQGLAGTKEIMEFIASEISPDTMVNIMDQYSPKYRAAHFPPIDRPITAMEYRDALDVAVKAGLHRFST